jgi:NAD(P)-dependent dehydrogenase (short-subunit alcohol dehydrogenase family)
MPVDASTLPSAPSEDPFRQVFPSSLGFQEGRGRLAGRRVLIVGAGQRPTPDPASTIGNGRAMSLLFAREGAEVVCADCRIDGAQDTVNLVLASGGRAYAVEADVSDPAAVQRMFDRSLEIMGWLDAVVANVGIASGNNLISETPEDWDRVLNVNLRAHMLIGQGGLAAIPPGGAILFISSLAAQSPAGKNPAYEASKAALSALCRAVALEGQTRGLRANALAPGLLDTPMGRAATERQPLRAARPLPFGRQGTAWEMAYVALFLISTEASYVNAQTIFVDGGLGSGVVLPNA